MMKTLLSALVAVTMLGCGVDQADAFRNGLPGSKDVALKLPGNDSALSSVGTRRDGLEGQTAEFYKTSRQVTVFVNGATAKVLNLVQQIVQQHPTTHTRDSAVWGPHTEPLSPTTWKLSVTRTGDEVYAYTLEGKRKQEPDSAFRVVLSGTHAKSAPNFGNGSFLVDFDQLSQLPETDGNVGTMAITYSRLAADAEVQIDAQFQNVMDRNALVDALYSYRAQPGHGGTFDFEVDRDLTGTPALERLKIRSRWLETGAGRSDVGASGGDLSAPVTGSECWDSDFASRFFATSFVGPANYGTESVCAFATAQYSAL